MSKIVYKVCRAGANGRFFSAINEVGMLYPNLDDGESIPRLEYKLGETTRARDDTLGVLCFENLSAAKDFSGGRAILKVLVRGRGRHPRTVSEHTWRPEVQSRHNPYRMPPPEGTVCYSEVTPVEVVT